MSTRAMGIALCLPLISGCALQLTGGKSAAGQSKAMNSATVALTMHALRKSNGIVGVRAGTIYDDGLVVKHGILHGGYDIITVRGLLTLEPGLDLGAGAPVSTKFDGVGAYAGFAGTTRLRLLGTGDREPSFNIAFPMIELVLMPRVGLWVPPEGSNSRTVFGEFAGEVGLRFAVGSDLATSAQGKTIDGSEGANAPAQQEEP